MMLQLELITVLGLIVEVVEAGCFGEPFLWLRRFLIFKERGELVDT